jgi:pimeloyl-ACP methyl ester carboxylesterase
MINGQDPSISFEPMVFEATNGEKVEAELGNLIVPESRERNNGKMLNLKFIRFKSTNPNPGFPIIYLAGGPGGSGINASKGSRFELFIGMRAISDVIAFDQRGTGISDGPPNYPGFWTLDPRKSTNRDEASEIIEKETTRALDFFTSKGVDLRNYNTNESADDLDDLRKALGEEKINLWGISYGTHLGLTYLKRHEKNLDKMIIAGVEGYDHTVKMPKDQQLLLERIAALLNSDPSTKNVYPDFLGQIKRLLEVLEKEPATVKSKNPMTGAPMDVVIGKFDMQMIISWTLRGPETFAALPWMVSEMLKGNYDVIGDYALYTHLGRFRGMSIAMDVASGISSKRLKKLEQERETMLLGDAINFPYLPQREALSDLDLGEEFRKPFYSEVPVLCISGTMDGRTPVENATETLEYLPNGRHLIIDGAGHSDPLFLSSPRILEVMLEFMNGENIKDETIVLDPVTFDLPQQRNKE